jgi:hypothetical protein
MAALVPAAGKPEIQSSAVGVSIGAVRAPLAIVGRKLS